jgi:hypothetical protein
MITCGTGTCPANQTCGGGGVPNVCGCTPTTCTAQGKNCGMISDGCGNMLNCGSTCPANQTCGGGGTANVCGCTPQSCGNRNCGTISDGCGGTPSCGSCTLPQTCGGGGTANVCGCLPTTCAAQGKNCGTISDGCGMTLSCGACVAPNTCGGGGIANVCGCTPDLEPDPTRTTPGMIRLFNNPAIRSYAYGAQSFLFKKATVLVQSIQLRGAYNVGEGKSIVNLALYPAFKDAPGSDPLWKQDFILGETGFRETDVAAKPTAATPNTFALSKPVKLDPEMVYFLVMTTNANSLYLYGYDGATLGGDAIPLGQAHSSTIGVPEWTPVPTADFHVVLNPCDAIIHLPPTF